MCKRYKILCITFLCLQKLDVKNFREISNGKVNYISQGVIESADIDEVFVNNLILDVQLFTHEPTSMSTWLAPIFNNTVFLRDFLRIYSINKQNLET